MSEPDYNAEYRRTTSSNQVMPLRRTKVVQNIFFGNAILMLIGLPFFSSYLEITLFAAILGIIIIGIFASLTSAKGKMLILLDMATALVGSFVFELNAINAYAADDRIPYFIFNQILAVAFFVALYLSIQSFRNLTWKQ